MPYKDPQKKKEYDRKYRLANKKRIDEYNKKWKKDNPDKRKNIGE